MKMQKYNKQTLNTLFKCFCLQKQVKWRIAVKFPPYNQKGSIYPFTSSSRHSQPAPNPSFPLHFPRKKRREIGSNLINWPPPAMYVRTAAAVRPQYFFFFFNTYPGNWLSSWLSSSSSSFYSIAARRTDLTQKRLARNWGAAFWWSTYSADLEGGGQNAWFSLR